MDLIGFNPVEPFEAVANGHLERDSAVTLLGASISATVSFLAGLARVPLVGTAFLWAAAAIKLTIQNSSLLLKDKMRFTYPKSLDDADLQASFVTIYKGD